MAMLIIASAIVYPAMQSFFRGRLLDSEARRMLALTQFARERAVSEGVPMVVWLNPQQGTYGMTVASGYDVTEDSLARSFDLGHEMSLDVAQPRFSAAMLASTARSTTTKSSSTSSILSTRPLQPISGSGVIMSRNVYIIEFTADGYIGWNSPAYIGIHEIRENQQDSVWLVQDTNRLRYAISTEKPGRIR